MQGRIGASDERLRGRPRKRPFEGEKQEEEVILSSTTDSYFESDIVVARRTTSIEYAYSHD